MHKSIKTLYIGILENPRERHIYIHRSQGRIAFQRGDSCTTQEDNTCRLWALFLTKEYASFIISSILVLLWILFTKLWSLLLIQS